jgi:hypothetical protein
MGPPKPHPERRMSRLSPRAPSIYSIKTLPEGGECDLTRLVRTIGDPIDSRVKKLAAGPVNSIVYNIKPIK